MAISNEQLKMNNLSEHNLQTDNIKSFTEIVFSAGDDSQIESTQDFVEIIGDNDNLWNLLLDKEVSRFNTEVSYRRTSRWSREDVREVKHFERGTVRKISAHNVAKVLIDIDYGSQFIVKYGKEQFIEQFDKISPPLSFNKITELVEREEESRKLQIERLEAQRRETQKREARRQEEEREAEKHRQEAKRRDAEKQTLLKRLKEREFGLS